MKRPTHKAANYKWLARSYSFWEYLTFGGQLQRCRFAFSNELENTSHVLLLGDGNGRFSTRLLSEYPALSITSLDASKSMLRQAKKRRKLLGIAEDRVHNINKNIFHWAPTNDDYDAIVAQFFFDSFNFTELEAIASKISSAIKPGGKLLVSEFHIPTDTLAGNLRAKLTLRFLYTAFGILTGLKTRKLEDHNSVLEKHGLRMNKTIFMAQKTLVAQVFRKGNLPS